MSEASVQKEYERRGGQGTLERLQMRMRIYQAATQHVATLPSWQRTGPDGISLPWHTHYNDISGIYNKHYMVIHFE